MGNKKYTNDGLWLKLLTPWIIQSCVPNLVLYADDAELHCRHSDLHAVRNVHSLTCMLWLLGFVVLIYALILL